MNQQTANKHVEEAIEHVKEARTIIERQKERRVKQQQHVDVSRKARKLGYCDAIIRMLREHVSTNSYE